MPKVRGAKPRLPLFVEIHNAARAKRKKLLRDSDPEAVDAVMNDDAVGVLALVRHALPREGDGSA